MSGSSLTSADSLPIRVICYRHIGQVFDPEPSSASWCTSLQENSSAAWTWPSLGHRTAVKPPATDERRVLAASALTKSKRVARASDDSRPASAHSLCFLRDPHRCYHRHYCRTQRICARVRVCSVPLRLLCWLQFSPWICIPGSLSHSLDLILVLFISHSFGSRFVLVFEYSTHTFRTLSLST